MKGNRTNEMTKDEYYMMIARIAGMQYDGNPHAAICLVDQDDQIMLIGSEISGALPLSDETDSDIRMYTTKFPDMDTAAKILHSNIHTLIYDEDGVSDSLSSLKIINRFHSAGITCRKYQKSGKTLALAL